MKKSKVLFFCWLLLLVISHESCQKREYSGSFDSESGTARFFATKGNLPSPVNRVIENLKQQNKLTGFIEGISKTKGIPVWEKAILVEKGKKGNQASVGKVEKNLAHKAKNFLGDSSYLYGDTLVFIPLVIDSTNYVNAYIEAKVSDSVKLTLYSADEYSMLLPSSNNSITDEKKAEDFAIRFMELGYEVFGKGVYNVLDPLLFREKVPDSLKNNPVMIEVGKNSPEMICYFHIHYVIVSGPWVNGVPPNGSMNYGSDEIDYVFDDCITVPTQGGGGQTGGDGGTPSTPGSGSGGGGGSGSGGGAPNEPCHNLVGSVLINGVAQKNNCLEGSTSTTGGGTGTPGWTPEEENPETALLKTLTKKDKQLISEVEQLEKDAENFVKNAVPCHGTFRIPGSMFFQQQATVAHLLIQQQYLKNNGWGLAEYFIPNSSATGGPGYADIVNTLTGEIFEIKSKNQIAAGSAEVNRYVAKANINCPPSAMGASSTFASWVQGTNYITSYLPNPLDPKTVVKAELTSSPGVITYSIVPNQTAPVTFAVPNSVIDIIKELVKRRNLYPNLSMNIIMESYLSQLAKTNSALLTDLKQNMQTVAYSIMVAYVAQALFTEGATLFTEYELYQFALNLLYFAGKL